MACGTNWDAARTSELLKTFNIGAREGQIKRLVQVPIEGLRKPT